MANDGRRLAPYTGGRFLLELDQKQPVGYVTSIDGGHFKSEVVQSVVGGRPGHAGGDFLVGRYPGKPKFEDITISVGAAMSPAFWKWIEATLNNKPERRNGALVGYDFDSKERSRRTFYRALISEIGFPSLDAASKSAALLSVKISPENLEYQEGDSSDLQFRQGQDEAKKQKMWLTSNFRFSLDKFKGDEVLRNAKIEGFTIKQNVITNPIGPERYARKEIGRIELPQIQVTFSERALGKWMAWYDSSVVQGKHEETTGVLTYLASDQSTELMHIELGGVGLTSLEVDKYEAGKESMARVKATLYVESMKLVSGKGTT